MIALTTALLFAQLPNGWYVSGNPEGYEVTPLSTGACGTPAFLLRSHDERSVGPAVVMQTFDARKYQGQRVRFSMKADARQVKGKAGLFVRVNEGARVVALDEMRNRWLRGDVPCQTVSVVLDVPRNLASSNGKGPVLSVGFALYGVGAVEFGDSQFETVTTEVPLTYREPKFNAGLGDVQFNANEVRFAGVTLAERQPDGVWLEGRRVVTVKGDTITQEGPGGGTLAMTATKERLAFGGTWAFKDESKPFTLVLTEDQLTLKWGTSVRELHAVEDTPNCTVYAAMVALTTRATDRVSVCGAVLQDPALRLPLVFASFVEGFDPRRADPAPESRKRGMGPSKPTRLPSTGKAPLTAPP